MSSDGENPAHPPYRTVESELPDEREPSDCLFADDAECDEQRHGDGEVEACPGLAQISG